MSDATIDWLNQEAEEIRLLGRDNPVRTCERCDHVGKDVVDCPSQTQYPWDGTGDDPNRDHVLCIECAIEITEQMNYQWSEYWSSVM
jgi:hypothetical protein